jgi:hypothetical protein
MSNESTTEGQALTTADAIPATDGGAIRATAGAEPPPADNDAAAAAVTTTAAATTASTTETMPTVTVPAPSIAVPAANRSRLSGVVILRRLLNTAVTVALLVAGIYAGWQYYTSNQPTAAPPGDPAVVGVPTPPIVSELANAIGADDANAIRVTLNAEMFSRYTADMERFGIQSIDGVTTLGTFSDGPRTATALVILGRSVDRNPFTINLVVIAQDGQIVRLR